MSVARAAGSWAELVDSGDFLIARDPWSANVRSAALAANIAGNL